MPPPPEPDPLTGLKRDPPSGRKKAGCDCGGGGGGGDGEHDSDLLERGSTALPSLLSGRWWYGCVGWCVWCCAEPEGLPECRGRFDVDANCDCLRFSTDKSVGGGGGGGGVSDRRIESIADVVFLVQQTGCITAAPQ